jgi:uncharacterized protein YydD (DUF2326 family)
MKCFNRDCDAGCYIVPDELIRKYKDEFSRIMILNKSIKKIVKNRRNYFGVLEVHGEHNCQLIKPFAIKPIEPGRPI